MQTDIVCAWQVEIGDTLDLEGITAEVYDIVDLGDETFIEFHLRDDDGLHWEYPIMRFPMETLNVVVSWEDPDE